MTSSISKQLKEKRKLSGLSVKEVVSRLSNYGVNISDKTYYGWENGTRTPDADEFIALCRILEISSIVELDSPATLDKDQIRLLSSYNQLDTWGKSLVQAVVEKELERCTAIAPTSQEENLIELNFNELKASAGIGWELMDEHMIPWVVKLNDLTRKADFCLEIEGDSMEPKFQDGDLILIRRQPSIEEGQFGLYTFDNRGYVKQQGCGKLHSLNPAYPDIFPGEYADIECKGLVLGKLEPEWIVSR